MIDVQSALVLRRSRQIDRVHAVLFEIPDDLLKRRLTVALALFAFVDHKTPETVSIDGILILGVQGEHTEADNLFPSTDRKRSRRAGRLGIGLGCLSQ